MPTPAGAAPGDYRAGRAQVPNSWAQVSEPVRIEALPGRGGPRLCEAHLEAMTHSTVGLKDSAHPTRLSPSPPRGHGSGRSTRHGPPTPAARPPGPGPGRRPRRLERPRPARPVRRRRRPGRVRRRRRPAHRHGPRGLPPHPPAGRRRGGRLPGRVPAPGRKGRADPLAGVGRRLAVHGRPAGRPERPRRRRAADPPGVPRRRRRVGRPGRHHDRPRAGRPSWTRNSVACRPATATRSSCAASKD